MINLQCVQNLTFYLTDFQKERNDKYLTVKKDTKLVIKDEKKNEIKRKKNL